MSEIPIKLGAKEDNGDATMFLPRRLDPVTAVELIVNKALTTSINKMDLPDVTTLVERVKKNDPLACGYCHYNIAKELGAVLGSWDENIRSVYAYGYDDNTSPEECFENISSTSLVHMIIWAERKTRGLSSLLEAIDRAMVQRLRNLLALGELAHVLDIQLIDDDDVDEGTGYAALLKSIYQTPVQVWGDRARA